MIFGIPSARAPVRAELPEARDTQVLVYRWHSLEPTETKKENEQLEMSGPASRRRREKFADSEPKCQDFL